MSTAQKIKKLFSGNTAVNKESPKNINSPNNNEEKITVNMYRDKLKKMLEDPKMAKKAAQIISEMINKK